MPACFDFAGGAVPRQMIRVFFNAGQEKRRYLMPTNAENNGYSRHASWLRDGVLIVLAFAIGWWAHTARTVRAQGSEVGFQFESMNPNSALSLYYPDQQAIYVYQPVAVGNSTLNCAFYFKLGNAGGPVKRYPCKAPSFQP
jgi:hypothetical protein